MYLRICSNLILLWPCRGIADNTPGTRAKANQRYEDAGQDNGQSEQYTGIKEG